MLLINVYLCLRPLSHPIGSYYSDLDASPPPSRLATCRNTCDERLQSAALESTLSFALSPASLDNLLSRGGRQSNSEEPPLPPPRVFDHGNNNSYKKSKPAGRTRQQQSVAPRPRRLPTLIKILTGFEDEPYWTDSSSSSNNHKPIIARIERPYNMLPKTRKRSRSSSSNKDRALSHKETVQIAAAAAAAAVWSRSLRIASDHRMQRINSEWDAALRWIAGWDQQLHLHSPSLSSWSDDDENVGDSSSLGQFTVNDSESLHHHGRVTTDVTQEGFDNFVDDLAKLLEKCISQCVDDANFEAHLRMDSKLDDGVSVPSFIGNMVSRSFLGWILENNAVGKLGISLESRFVLTKTVQFVTSSVVIYALLSLCSLVSPLVFHWYSSLGYKESPEWLLEHEKDIQLAKSARSRQKKKSKRRQLTTTRTGGKNKQASSLDEVKKDSLGSSVHEKQRIDRSSNTNAAIHVSQKDCSILPSNPCKGEYHNESDSGHPAPSSTASVPGSPCSTSSGGVPSMISCPSTSVSSFPSIKPSCSLLEDNDPYEEPLHAPSPPLLHLNPTLSSQPPSMQHQKALPVPTQEQRNEAAKQLREFQNAQIQRLLIQRKLSQAWSDGRSNETSTALRGGSLHSAEYASSTASVGGQSKVLKPPPGLSLPSEPQPPCNNQDDKHFLTDNEMFLTKLLDDEEDDLDNPSAHQLRINSSLDPTAVEFFSENVRTQQANATFPISEKQEGDAWQVGSIDLPLNSNSPTRMMKGVYGGSVW